MATFHPAPSKNYISTTLNGAINDSVQTITLNSVTSLSTSGGVLVINREDGNGTATPNSREIFSYTGVAGNDVTGVTRAFDGSTARSHADTSLVEAVFTVGMWNDVRDALAASLTTAGTGIALSGVASITSGEVVNLAVVSAASIFQVEAQSVAVVSIASIAEAHFTVVKQGMTSVAGAATIDLDFNTGNKFTSTMPDSEMGITVTNESDGQLVLLDIKQRAQVSAPSITWPATVTWAGGTEPTLTSGSAKTDTLGFRVTGTNTYFGSVVDQNF